MRSPSQDALERTERYISVIRDPSLHSASLDLYEALISVFVMEEIIGKQVSYWDLLPLELQEYIQTLAIHQHVKDRLHMGWEVIHDSFRPCVFSEKRIDSRRIVLSNKLKFY